MQSLTVDFAAKFSAVCYAADGEVHREFDSGNMSMIDFVERLANIAKFINDRHPLDVILVEDVPYHEKNHVKNIFRAQGILILRFAQYELLDKVLWINPSTWQKEFAGVARAPKGVTGAAGQRARVEAARLAALELGYTAPPLVQDYIDSLPEGTKVLKKNTDPLAKQMTDYVDAFLMHDWLRRFDGDLDRLRATVGVQPTLL